MGCTCAPILLDLRAEMDWWFPRRDRASDGCCASPKHTQQNPSSAHELGNAYDADRDLSATYTSHQYARQLAERMLAGKAPWVAYLISDGQIFNPAVAPHWRPYRGSNPHTSHAHIEIKPSWRWSKDVTWFVLWHTDKEWDEMATKAEVKDAMREVLNEATAPGQRSGAGTISSTLKVAQGNSNKLDQLLKRTA